MTSEVVSPILLERSRTLAESDENAQKLGFKLGLEIRTFSQGKKPRGERTTAIGIWQRESKHMVEAAKMDDMEPVA